MAFSLKDLEVGRKPLPPRLGCYGQDKIGKSTFAAGAPKPVFIQTEDGLSALDVAKFPLATSYEDVTSAINSLITEDHEYKTAVLDSVDWLEKLLWQKVCSDEKVDSIEAIGYGKGYVMACDHWRTILQGLNKLREEKNMAVILIAHCLVKRFDDPTAESYDRYILSTHKDIASTMREWVDALGFAHQDFVVHKEDVGFGKKTARAVETAASHVMHLRRTPAFDAGNRYGLPDKIDLSWAAFADAFAAAHS